jgi:anti-sigma factor RsiW
MSASSTKQAPHGPDWSQRLEEWRDGLADAAESAAIETHLASCTECQDYLEALNQIDAALSTKLQVAALSADFDSKIWSRIDASNDIQRALAKQRAQEDLQQQLAALNAGWKRKVLLMIPGLVAGIALAVWVGSLLTGTGLMASFATMLQQSLGPSMGQLIQTLATGFLGGAIGLAMSQWVVPSSD